MTIREWSWYMNGDTYASNFKGIGENVRVEQTLDLNTLHSLMVYQPNKKGKVIDFNAVFSSWVT